MPWISFGRSWLPVARFTNMAYQDAPSGSADKATLASRTRQVFGSNEIVQLAIGGQQLVLHRAAPVDGSRWSGIEHVAGSILAEALQQRQHPLHQYPRRGVAAPHSLAHVRDRLLGPADVVVDPQPPMGELLVGLARLLAEHRGRARELQAAVESKGLTGKSSLG